MGGRTAFVRLRPGEPPSLTWQDYGRQIRDAARALIALGIAPGDRVALVGRGTPEWAVADFAIMAVGASSVPLYRDLPPEGLALAVRGAGCRAVVADPEVDAAAVVRAAELGDAPAVALGEPAGSAMPWRRDGQEAARDTLAAGASGTR